MGNECTRDCSGRFGSQNTDAPYIGQPKKSRTQKPNKLEPLDLDQEVLLESYKGQIDQINSSETKNFRFNKSYSLNGWSEMKGLNNALEQKKL